MGLDNTATEARRDVQYFITATNDYIRKYAGRVWVFDEFDKIDEPTQEDFIKSLKRLDAFAQQMIVNLEGVRNGIR